MSTVVVIPAIDLLGGRCVRLLRGDYEDVTVYSDDPVAVAGRFAEAGAQRIHVVDLDAARGSGDNRAVIESMLRRQDVAVEVAGGVRSAGAVDGWVDAGAHAVVMGTVAVRDPRLLERCARKHPGRVLAALDVRDDKAAVSGWLETEPVLIGALLGRWDRLPLAGVILTCIDRDGTLGGPDLQTLARVRAMTGLPVQYSGGVSSAEDIGRIAAAGAQAVILGKALYEGRLTLEEALAQ
ncbi:1-(5-phosphoribosyl)-5-[(5-phosphoribosylamino)methylideneamino]imidazole-4-carboxamide isomerase [bacterium]|nr:MAG: 1-(5-phosphoribosyl)-5-[(5-phosphoribosylamino)methylideneamino]imidazole-4-carboxamide isomerase [bacterium]